MEMVEQSPINATQLKAENSFDDAIDTNILGCLTSSHPKLQNYTILNTEVTIGRSENCTIVIDDRRISSVHCSISPASCSPGERLLKLTDLRYDLFFQ